MIHSVNTGARASRYRPVVGRQARFLGNKASKEVLV